MTSENKMPSITESVMSEKMLLPERKRERQRETRERQREREFCLMLVLVAKLCGVVDR